MMTTSMSPSLPERSRGLLRPAEENDLPEIVMLHERAFRKAFLTRLGSGFLHSYYRVALSYPARIFLISESGGKLEGFACGFLHPEEFYRLMRRRQWSFLIPMLLAVLRQPSLIARVIYRVESVRKPAPEESGGMCELSSIAVVPEAAGKGIGKALIRAFLAQAWAMGAAQVYLSTDADHNEPVNAFYRKAGFHLQRRFGQYKGRLMNHYEMARPEPGAVREEA